MKDVLDFKNLKAQIIFANESQDEETFHQEDLIRLFPFGLSVSTDTSRPFLLLKDEAHQYTLPVAVSPIDAGVAMAQSNRGIPQASPHRFTAMLMEATGVEIKQAVFVEIKGAYQYLRLYVSGIPQNSSFKLRSDEVMSLALYLDVPIYATKKFIGRSRVLSAEMEGSTQNANALQSFERGPRGFLN